MSYTNRVALLGGGYGLGSDVASASSTSGCSTAGVSGIDAQLVAEMIRLSEGKLVEVRHPNIKFTSNRVHPYLAVAARDALLKAAESGEIRINSALRTVVDQYMLHKGCPGATVPGGSNHESGKAINVSNWPDRQGALRAAGFSQPLGTNQAYFEVPGEDLRKLSVKAFQNLWNLNNPTDQIGADGVAGPATLQRIAKAPVAGFANSTVAPVAPVENMSIAPPAPGETENPVEPRRAAPAAAGNTGKTVLITLASVGVVAVLIKLASRGGRGKTPAPRLAQNRSRSSAPRRNPTTYVVEPECAHCGAPLGEGVTGVREMREGDKLGERGLNDDEIPERFQDAAAHAHPRQAIKRWGTCRDCRDY
jgi:hypothetical protein